MNTTDLMRQDWNERARKDAFFYIASWRKDWNEDSFFESGEQDYRILVAPAFERWQWDPRNKAMLELGCGAGRMTRSFAQRFSRVYAFDISSEMLQRAQVLLPGASNIHWFLGNGTNLSGLGDGSVEFVFSYIVLQHMPEPAIALRYIREMLRVLRPGGAFLFQFNSLRRPTMNWKGRIAWALVDLPWTLGLRSCSRGVASVLGLPEGIAGRSWRGPALNAGAVRDAVQSAGGIVLEMTGENTPMTWCGGKKARVSV